MPAKNRTNLNDDVASGTTRIPQSEWGAFLEELGRTHHGWLTSLETTDHVTGETVESHAMPLRDIELDLEDEKHARINVVVRLDNKELKHILFELSRVVLRAGVGDADVLEVETMNTSTRIRLRRENRIS